MFCLKYSVNKPNSLDLAIYTHKTGLGTEEINHAFIMVVLQASGCLSFTWLMGLGLGFCVWHFLVCCFLGFFVLFVVRKISFFEV